MVVATIDKENIPRAYIASGNREQIVAMVKAIMDLRDMIPYDKD
jgi:hypothetical protein